MQSPSPTASPPPSSSRELKPGSGGPPGGPPGPPGPGPDELFRPKTLKFWLILLSNFLAMFLVALDRTIVATAIPRITDDFHSLGDIGWYGSAYMLTTATSQLVFGRLYKFYNMKWYVLVALQQVIPTLANPLTWQTKGLPVLCHHIRGRVCHLRCCSQFGSLHLWTSNRWSGFGRHLLRGHDDHDSHDSSSQETHVPEHVRNGLRNCLCPGTSSWWWIHVRTHLEVSGSCFPPSPIRLGLTSCRWCFYINLPIGGFTL